MRRIALLVALASLAVAFSTVIAAAAVGVGPNVNVSKKTNSQTEAAVAINPANAMQAFVAANDETTNFAGIFVARSGDGGTTWTPSVVGTGVDTFNPACCDPSVAWDSFGNLFVAYISIVTDTVDLLLSTNGGSTFTNAGPVQTDPNGVDQETVVVGANSVWLTWADSGGLRARGRAVTALGTLGAWGPIQTVTATDCTFGDIAVGPSGQVLVTCENPSGTQGPASILNFLDADGLGAGGFAPVGSPIATNVGGFDFIPPQPDRSVDAEAGLAYDRSGGANNGRVYLVYTDETVNENYDTNIFVRFSDNNGSTWSAPVRVNDDVGTNSQFLPRIALDQTNGYVAVTWHDARSDTEAGGDGPNNDAEFWGTRSVTAGLTWDPNFKISAGISDEDGSEPPTAGYADIDYGDYTGLDYNAGVIRPVWADNSNSTADNPNGATEFDIYTAAITSPTAVLARELRATRRTGGVEVSWRGVLGSGAAGYEVYRASPRGDGRVGGFVRARGTALHRFVDRTARRGVAYTYRLAVVGLDGSRTWAGATGVR